METRVDPKFFKGIGLWQLVVEKRVNYWVALNFFFGVIFLLNVTIQILVTVSGNWEFNVFTEKLAVNLTVMESVVKIFYYCGLRSKLATLATCFDEDLLLCASHEPERKKILREGFATVNRVTRSFVTMIFATVGVWNALPLLRCATGSCTGQDWRIMPSWYPEDTFLSSPAFAYPFEFSVMVFCASLLYTVNCFFSALALSLSSQFGLLSASLASLEDTARSKCDGRAGSKSAVMDSLLRDCLQDHQLLLKLSEEMESVYNPLFLLQMLVSTFTICLVLVQLNVSTSSNSMPFVVTCKFLMYLVFGSMELLVYSFGGQILKNQAEEMHWSLYCSGWSEGSLQFKKNVLIAMCRTMKPVYLTAGKFYSVDLQSFTQIIKASYSYFTFLHGSSL